jgi:myo-inositol-1(or 4)-monophosphatase
MTQLEVVTQLARRIRALVRPHLGRRREQVGFTHSGDASFSIDQIAEESLVEFIAGHGLDLAYHSEDRGTVGRPGAEGLLIVDPIDGSRPANAGLESCCVSVALAQNRPGATMGDVTHACVHEIKQDVRFTATRGGGVEILLEGEPFPVQLSETTDPQRMAWSLEFPGRPAALVVAAVGDLIDDSSVLGGVFAFASSTFSITRLLTGQLEAYVDVGNRVLRDYPATEPAFRRAALGNIMGLFPYDLAAVALIAQEAGAVITDGYGRPLDSVLLTDDSVTNQQSCLAAANAALHERLRERIERGIERLGEWLACGG